MSVHLPGLLERSKTPKASNRMTVNIAFETNYFNHIACSDMIYVVEVPVPTNSQNSVNYKYGRNITSVKKYCYFKYDYCNTCYHLWKILLCQYDIQMGN